MKAIAATVEDKIDELLVVLDRDIQHIENSISQLDELRSLVIKRDDVALGKLLGSIRVEANSYAANELKRQSIRKDLANALGYSVKQMTLSQFEITLPKEKKAQITNRKAKLLALIKKLKKEHSSTVLLLSECTRLNSLLLRTIFNLEKTGTVIYSSSGATKRQSDMAFVNMQF